MKELRWNNNIESASAIGVFYLGVEPKWMKKFIIGDEIIIIAKDKKVSGKICSLFPLLRIEIKKEA